jgi:CubicO group peptidase (beta-lactamase class C family)
MPAEPPWANAVAQTLRAMHVAYDLPGLSCSVRHGDASAWTLSLGLASPSLQVPVSPTTMFHTGSVGKHMTAVALLSVMERGLLDLDDAAGEHLANIPPAWRPVTVRQLLQQTSGIVDYIAHVGDDRGLPNGEVYRRLEGMPLLFAPGSCWSYSNTNYRVVGDLAAAAAGTRFEDLVDDLFARAGLAHTRLDDADELVPQHAEPCAWADGRWRRACAFYAINVGSADGGVAMNALDAAAWDRALWGGRLVSPRSLALMQQPTRLPGGLLQPYGFGLALQDVDPARPTVGHAGAVPGFMAQVFHAPTEALGVMVMANGLRAPGLRHVAEAVAEQIAPGLTAVGLAEHDAPLDDQDRQVRALLFRGRQPVDEAGFAPQVRPVLGPQCADRTVPDFSAIGMPNGFARLRPGGASNGLRVYRIRWGERVEHVRVARLDDGLVWRIALT